MSKAAPGFSLNSFTMASGDWYKKVSYEDAKNLIKEKMVSSAENFVAIGYYLKHISETGQYKEGGYSNIWECAENEFGFSQAKASRCINICKTYSADGDSPFLGDRFKSFNISQLQEMLPIKDERLIEQITPDMSVKEIRDMRSVKKAEDAGEAAGNEILPGQMQIDTIEGDFREFGAAPDNEGDLAVKRESLPLREIPDEDDSDFLEEKQESDLKEPTDEEIRDFYKKFVKGQYDCNRDDLKNKLREAMGKTYHYYGDPDGISCQCSPRGVAINSSKEITWTKLVKRIGELIPEGEPKNTASAEPAKHEITQLPCDEENIEKAVNAIFGLRSSNIFPDSKMNAIVEAFREKKDVNRSSLLIFDEMLPFKNDIVEVAYQCGYLVNYIYTNESINIPVYPFWKAFEGCFGWMWKRSAGTEEDDNILIMHESGGEAESADKGCEFQINMERITVRIPCAVGESVFFRDGNEVKNGAVDLITFGEGMKPNFRVYDNKGEWFHFETDDFGKLLFYTYKDAEKGSCN